MSYILHTDESLSDGIQRILLEQIDDSLSQLHHQGEGIDESIHEARKDLKKIRAVFRLIRGNIRDSVYHENTILFRDAGRKLSDVRDSVVMRETVEKLHQHFGERLPPQSFQAVRANLIRRHENALQHAVSQGRTIQNVVVTLQEARLRIAGWDITLHDFLDLSQGLKRVYKRGRKAFSTAYADPADDHFHEWRKCVKNLWYHICLLQQIWPEILGALADELHALADYLGDDHDLSELHRILSEDPALFNEDASRDMLLGLIRQRQLELRTAARPCGERIYAENPSQFTNRIGVYWKICRS